jgi:hypothetical protein
MDIDVRLRNRWIQPPQIRTKEELLEHLSRPLSDDEKIPVSQSKFDECIGMSTMLDSDDLATIWRISSDLEAPSYFRRFMATVFDKRLPTDPSAASYASLWQQLIGDTLDGLEIGTYIRRMNDDSSTGLKRPDCYFRMKGHALFRGEERGIASGENLIAELFYKLKWTYDPLPFILGGSWTPY